LGRLARPGRDAAPLAGIAHRLDATAKLCNLAAKGIENTVKSDRLFCC